MRELSALTVGKTANYNVATISINLMRKLSNVYRLQLPVNAAYYKMRTL